MQLFKHYSFDLWMTLIRSNPAFKTERAKYFHQHFNRLHKTVEELQAIFREIDLMCNEMNEVCGGSISAEEMYLMVIYRINEGKYPLQEVDLPRLYVEMDHLFFEFMPSCYDEHTKSVLSQLASETDATMSLLSNTAFIKGSSLRKLLKMLDLAQYFSFQLYSDEVKMSKPNPALFALMFEQIVGIYDKSAITLIDVLHVGDNPVADERGAISAGMQALLVNSNDKTLRSILT